MSSLDVTIFLSVMLVRMVEFCVTFDVILGVRYPICQFVVFYHSMVISVHFKYRISKGQTRVLYIFPYDVLHRSCFEHTQLQYPIEISKNLVMYSPYKYMLQPYPRTLFLKSQIAIFEGWFGMVSL